MSSDKPFRQWKDPRTPSTATVLLCPWLSKCSAEKWASRKIIWETSHFWKIIWETSHFFFHSAKVCILISVLESNQLYNIFAPIELSSRTRFQVIPSIWRSGWKKKRAADILLLQWHRSCSWAEHPPLRHSTCWQRAFDGNQGGGNTISLFPWLQAASNRYLMVSTFLFHSCVTTSLILLRLTSDTLNETDFTISSIHLIFIFLLLPIKSVCYFPNIHRSKLRKRWEGCYRETKLRPNSTLKELSKKEND